MAVVSKCSDGAAWKSNFPLLLLLCQTDWRTNRSTNTNRRTWGIIGKLNMYFCLRFKGNWKFKTIQLQRYLKDKVVLMNQINLRFSPKYFSSLTHYSIIWYLVSKCPLKSICAIKNYIWPLSSFPIIHTNFHPCSFLLPSHLQRFKHGYKKKSYSSHLSY